MEVKLWDNPLEAISYVEVEVGNNSSHCKLTQYTVWEIVQTQQYRRHSNVGGYFSSVFIFDFKQVSTHRISSLNWVSLSREIGPKGLPPNFASNFKQTAVVDY